MRLLYIIDSLVPGGAEQSLAALAPRYAARGVSLEVAFLHDRPGLHGVLEEAGARLVSIAGAGGRAGWVSRAARLVRRRRPDLLHTTLFEADTAGRMAGALAGIPVVSSLVNVAYGPEMLDAPELRRWRVRAAQLVDVSTARLVRRFHAVSGHVAEVMAPRLHIPLQRIEVVPRGRDERLLGSRSPERSARGRALLGVGAESPLLLAVARQERQKGLDLAVLAMPFVLERIPTARLAVAGREGNQTGSLRASVRRLGLAETVRFLGPRNDVPDLLAAADVFVFPSRWEGMPGTVLEAMALEAPIVASDIPTVREAVDEQTAALVPTEDPQALAQAVVATLTEPDRSAERARRARERFLELFTIDRSADLMVALYERALGGA